MAGHRGLPGMRVGGGAVVVLTPPHGGARVPGAAGLTALAGAVAGASALALWARHSRWLALLAAVAGGVLLGVGAVLLRAVVGGWHGHPDAHWYLRPSWFYRPVPWACWPLSRPSTTGRFPPRSPR
jgi:hypothetical protein